MPTLMTRLLRMKVEWIATIRGEPSREPSGRDKGVS